MHRNLVIVGLAWTLLLAGAASADPIAGPVVVAAHGPARGTVVLIHPGGWSAYGEAATQSMLSIAQNVADWGFRAISVDYSPGTAGLADVLRQIDAIHAGNPGPLCVLGVSSGGHWALMEAASRSWVNCTIALIAPTDLLGATIFAPGSYLAQTVQSVFGGALLTYSPLARAGQIRGRVLLVYGIDDAVVPLAQGLVMHAALGGRSKLVVLPHGSVAWGHSATTADAVAALDRTERRWLVGTNTRR